MNGPTIAFWAGFVSCLLLVSLPGYLHWREQLRRALNRVT